MVEGSAAGAGPSVAVIGAGVVGTCVALALRRRGARVTLIDRDAPGSGCSRGNSGAISSNSVVPLATPGLLASLPGMLFDPLRPLRVPLHYLPHAAPWLARFARAAAPGRVAASVRSLSALHADALSMHRALATEVGVPELLLVRGHLHLYRDEHAYSQDSASWAIRAECGHPHERLDRDGILALEPHIGPRYQAAAFLPNQGTITNPLRYVQAIAACFVARGGELWQAEVHRLAPQASGGWSLESPVGRRRFDHAVVAAGAWSRRLLDPLGVRLPLESQRGYHVQFARHRDVVSRTVVFTDHKVFVTPMEEGVRVGGTVEMAGLATPPDWCRAAMLERIARDNLQGVEDPPSSRWAGHRPCMPDSVPVIGPASGHHGLWLAVGHGHLGLTDAPATSERIADALTREAGATPASACTA